MAGPRRVLLVGEPYFAHAQARRLTACGFRIRTLPTTEWKRTGRTGRWRHLAWAHDVLFIYLKVAPRDLTAARILRCRPSILFIGSDVLRLQNASRNYRQALAARLGYTRLYAVSHALARETEMLGLPAQHLPFIARPLSPEPVPLPDQFTVVSYIPPGKEEFYGLSAVRQLAQARPSWRFIILGHDGTGLGLPADTACTGWVDDPAPYLKNASVYIRLTEHDGLPNLLVESLAYGRHAVWTFTHPHCYRYRGHTDLCRHLDELAVSNRPNDAGRTYVTEQYGEAALRRRHASLFS